MSKMNTKWLKEQILLEEDSYESGVKMLGNGWTVDVIAHIFKGLKPQDVAQID